MNLSVWLIHCFSLITNHRTILFSLAFQQSDQGHQANAQSLPRSDCRGAVTQTSKCNQQREPPVHGENWNSFSLPTTTRATLSAAENNIFGQAVWGLQSMEKAPGHLTFSATKSNMEKRCSNNIHNIWSMEITYSQPTGSIIQNYTSNQSMECDQQKTKRPTYTTSS
jgi:hypothetical protein